MAAKRKKNIYWPPTPHKRPLILIALAWYSSAIHKGIARYARQANWILDISMTRYTSLPRSWKGDGIISLLQEQDSPLFDLVSKAKVPVVNIGAAGLRGAPNVRPDDEMIGKMAADHFIGRGFNNFAFFTRSDDPAGIRRCKAYFEHAKQAGGQTFLLDWFTQNKGRRNYSGSALMNWLGKKLAQLPKPLAVFSEHDDPAIEVIYACLGMDIPVPEQVAVLGVDNDELRCEFSPVPLSSINHNQELEGYEAAVILDRMLRGETNLPPLHLIPPVSVVSRLSTDILAIKHVHVAKALLTIWQNYTKAINAKTVAATVPISYRRLHDAFLENVGRTIADEITYKRMEMAKNLLVNTGQSIRDISESCGFSSEDRMGRIFRRELNTTPVQYRQQNKRK